MQGYWPSLRHYSFPGFFLVLFGLHQVMVSVRIFGTDLEVFLIAVCSLDKLVVLLICNSKVKDGVAALRVDLQGTQIKAYGIVVLP